MAKENKENSIFEKALLNYEQVVEVVKKQLTESHSKELNERLSELLKETENISLYKEPETVKEESQSTEAIVQESAPADNTEAINMKEASMKEIEEAFDAASDDDEFKVVKSDDNNGTDFSLTDIEGEISEVMSEIEAAENTQQVEPTEEVDNLTKFKQLHEEMGKIIEALNAEKGDMALKEQFHQKMTEMMGQGYENKLGVGECTKMYETFKSNSSASAAPVQKSAEAAPIQEEKTTAFTATSGVAGTHNPNPKAGGGSFPTTAVPAEKSLTKAVTETEIPVEEGHGLSLSHNKKVGEESQPRIDVAKDYAKDKVRVALQKEQNEKLQKRINSLVKENFELSKKSNKAAISLKEMTKINESYKENIDKYRKQLTEMALVATNVANVNNIFMEGFALSLEDKKKIVNEFKEVSTVEQSESTYKKIIKEYSEGKKTIKESVEHTINNSVIEASSSKEVAEKVEEPSQLNEHVEKIKKLSVYKPKNK
jgi:hypothetical protein